MSRCCAGKIPPRMGISEEELDGRYHFTTLPLLRFTTFTLYHFNTTLLLRIYGLATYLLSFQHWLLQLSSRSPPRMLAHPKVFSPTTFPPIRRFQPQLTLPTKTKTIPSYRPYLAKPARRRASSHLHSPISLPDSHLHPNPALHLFAKPTAHHRPLTQSRSSRLAAPGILNRSSPTSC